MHVDLSDLDHLMDTPRTGVQVSNEELDVSAHTLAASAADVWEVTPLQTKDGFGRVREQTVLQVAAEGAAALVSNNPNSKPA